MPPPAPTRLKTAWFVPFHTNPNIIPIFFCLYPFLITDLSLCYETPTAFLIVVHHMIMNVFVLDFTLLNYVCPAIYCIRQLVCCNLKYDFIPNTNFRTFLILSIGNSLVSKHRSSTRSLELALLD